MTIVIVAQYQILVSKMSMSEVLSIFSLSVYKPTVWQAQVSTICRVSIQRPLSLYVKLVFIIAPCSIRQRFSKERNILIVDLSNKFKMGQ